MSGARIASLALAALLTLGGPAFAQKSKGIVRIAEGEPIKGIDTYNFPVKDAMFFAYHVFEPLARYDERVGKFVPALARSWKRVDPTTLEFELRDDIKFTNGDPVSADDVVNILTWRIDPKVRLAFKERTADFKGAEKIGPHTVRIYTKRPVAIDLLTLAYQVPVYDWKVFAKLEDKSDYGKQAIGTGAIKLVTLDNNTGLVFERNDAYDRGAKPAYKTLIAVPIPDRQTQSAHLLAGSIDAMKVGSKDEFDEMAKVPTLASYSKAQYQALLMHLDQRGRSGVKPLADERVRRAISMAIDRAGIAKSLIPGTAELINSVCLKGMLGCPTTLTNEPPSFDVAGAKKLLAEAGYPNGFDLVITSRTLARSAAVAVAGQLRAIGINATVDYRTVVAYRKLRTDGGLQVDVVDTPVGSLPDASNPLNQDLSNDDFRLMDDRDVDTWSEQALGELDPQKRTAIYSRIFSRINEKSYVFPIANWPDAWIHVKGLTITSDTWQQDGVSVLDFAWQ